VFRIFLYGVVINQNVVYVNDHKVIKPLSENVIHEGAKCGGCITYLKPKPVEFVVHNFEAKWQDNMFEQCLENLIVDHIVLVVDYVENYSF